MKKLLIIIAIGLLQLNLITCQSNDTTIIINNKEEIASSVRVYYFHGTRRCTTCRTVEEVTNEILNTYYMDELATKKISFASLNLEKENNKPIVNDLRISGQTLLFVSEKDTVNLTRQAFMNAVANPLKLTDLIIDTVDEMLK